MRTIGLPAALALATIMGSASAASSGGAALYNNGVGSRVPSCASCHGPDGAGLGAIPRLAGLPAPYLIAQLQAFRSGKRKGPMTAIAKNMTDSEIASVAQWLATRPLSQPPPVSTAADSDLVAGEALVTLGDWSKDIPACSDCHGPRLEGGGPLIPRLAGHSAAYLEHALKTFASGERPPGPLGLMGKIAARMSTTQIKAAAAFIGAQKPWPPEIPRPVTPRAWPVRPQNPEHFTPPPEDAMPNSGGLAQAIVLGEEIFDDTPTYAGEYTANALSCRNCHLERGRLASSSPMWAVPPAYPLYRAKNGKVNTLAMRLQGCFRYSQNGKAPPADGSVMIALESYLDWLATGLPIGSNPSARGYPKIAAPERTPDRKRGAAVYVAHCSLCHGDMGQGRHVADALVFPPLWGPQSFNWGAGMHELGKAAAFIHANMPLGLGGTLSVQQAWDVAAWMDSQPRPQDPRYTESVEKTRKLYHADPRFDYYGRTIDGLTLGAPGTLAAWIKTHPDEKPDEP
ncbi:MAG: c-type cytochrome [Gammaproteobacteria bacterium]